MVEMLLGYKRAADRELLEYVGTANQKLPPSSRREVLRQLDHINAVDQIFKAHLAGATHGLASTMIDPEPDLAELSDRILDVDAWLVTHAAAATAEALAQSIQFRFTDGSNGTMSRLEMLAHVAIHASYHRGSVWALLRQSSSTPSSLTLAGWLHALAPERRLHA